MSLIYPEMPFMPVLLLRCVAYSSQMNVLKDPQVFSSFIRFQCHKILPG